MKKKDTSKHSFLALRNILLAPFVLYLAIYMFSLTVAVLHGGTPLIYSAVTNSFKDTALRLYGLRNAGILYNVATKEVEDCDTNPMEYYPEGYVDGVREYGRGLIYSYDLYQVKNFGFPQRFVEGGHSCLPNSQDIKLHDIIGESSLNSLTTKFRPGDKSALPRRSYYSGDFVQITTEQYQYSITFDEDESFFFMLNCLSIKGDYSLEQDTLQIESITKHLVCKENDLSYEEKILIENLSNTFRVDVYQGRFSLWAIDESIGLGFRKKISSL